MAKTFFIVLAAALVVAALAFELNDDFEDEAADVEFMKRDPGMQEYLMAEKRGRNLKKYKSCEGLSGQACLCHRKTNKYVFCNGAGNGDAM